jgi:hypothetical protein
MAVELSREEQSRKSFERSNAPLVCSDREGYFTIRNLLPGSYRLAISHPDFMAVQASPSEDPPGLCAGRPGERTAAAGWAFMGPSDRSGLGNGFRATKEKP